MAAQPNAALLDRSHRPLEASRLILLLGVVSLFADATYESARSVLGPYLATLGADGTTVGIISGLGQLIGYGLRLGSGYLADRTGRYWELSLIGFSLNMIAVPLLAFAGRWELVVVLIVMERTGKAIRNPPRDAILSHAAQAVGSGWGFGLQEALGQIGAVCGPIAISVGLSYHLGYSACFGALAVPAALTLAFLFYGARTYPNPQSLEPVDPGEAKRPFPMSFWLLLAASVLIAAGSLDFPLVAYHLRTHELMPESRIPVLYAVAMGSHAISALGFGMAFDRMGPRALLAISVLSLPVAPLAFGNGAVGVYAAMVLAGLSMGAQKAMFKATIAQMSPAGRRGTAYGFFDIGYGVFWFLGSSLMGYCYDHSLSALIVVAVGLQLAAAAPLLLVAWSRCKR